MGLQFDKTRDCEGKIPRWIAMVPKDCKIEHYSCGVLEKTCKGLHQCWANKWQKTMKYSKNCNQGDTMRWELPFLAPLAVSLKITSFKLCLSVQKALQWADIQCVMAAV